MLINLCFSSIAQLNRLIKTFLFFPRRMNDHNGDKSRDEEKLDERKIIANIANKTKANKTVIK